MKEPKDFVIAFLLTIIGAIMVGIGWINYFHKQANKFPVENIYTVTKTESFGDTLYIYNAETADQSEVLIMSRDAIDFASKVLIKK